MVASSGGSLGFFACSYQQASQLGFDQNNWLLRRVYDWALNRFLPTGSMQFSLTTSTEMTKCSRLGASLNRKSSRTG